MDYEQKYNAALDAARHIYDAMKSGGNFEGMEDLEVIFPELYEGEDERIRKALIEALKTSKSIGELKFILPEPTREECIAYLEKQKEQKEIPLMDGDADLYFDEWNQQQQNPTKRQCFEEGMIYVERLQKEQKPAEWSEEDEEMLKDCIEEVGSMSIRSDVKELRDWLSSLSIRFNLQTKQEWSKGDEEIISSIVDDLERLKNNSTGLTGEHAYQTKINWLKSIRPQPKEEDCNYITPNKEFFQWIYDRLINVHKENPDIDYMRSFKKRINNLSFKDKHRWKPSKEQMDALWTAKSYYGRVWACDIQKALESLYNDLEKQM